MTKWVIVFAKDMYFASVHWKLFHLILFGNRQCTVRQENWPSKV